MKEINVDATVESLPQVQEFIELELEMLECPMKAVTQLLIAVEEIFVNIAHYAYNPEVGNATIRISVENEPMQVCIQFLDQGKPFDPLAKKDADVTLSADEREIGGLGIYMVKKSMDEVSYSYENGKNILTIKKVI